MRSCTLSQWRDLRIWSGSEDLGAATTARARKFWICWIRDWTELSVIECVRTAQDRAALRAKVAGFGLQPSQMRKKSCPVSMSLSRFVSGIVILVEKRKFFIPLSLMPSLRFLPIEFCNPGLVQKTRKVDNDRQKEREKCHIKISLCMLLRNLTSPKTR